MIENRFERGVTRGQSHEETKRLVQNERFGLCDQSNGSGSKEVPFADAHAAGGLSVDGFYYSTVRLQPKTRTTETSKKLSKMYSMSRPKSILMCFDSEQLT